MSDRDFKTFPKDKVDALALLYTQAQDLTGKTPEEVYAIFTDADNRIRAEIRRQHGSGN